MHAFRHAPNGLVHRCHDYPIHGVALELIPRPSNALADDRCVVLHRDHCACHPCVNELDPHDAAHLFADETDDHQNCVDDHHHDADDLNANRDPQTCRPKTDDLMKGDRDPQDGRHRDVDETDDLACHRSGHVLVDDHHHDADDLDANRDPQTFRLKTDDLTKGDLILDGQTMDDRDPQDGRHRDADETDDQSRNCVADLDGHHRVVVGKVVNRHDEGLWLQRHLGELDGLNHYLVLGDADRFCLV